VFIEYRSLQPASSATLCAMCTHRTLSAILAMVLAAIAVLIG
jgi:hypothetical protein